MLHGFVFLTDLPISMGTKLAGVAGELGGDVSGAEIVAYAIMITLTHCRSGRGDPRRWRLGRQRAERPVNSP